MNNEKANAIAFEALTSGLNISEAPTEKSQTESNSHEAHEQTQSQPNEGTSQQSQNICKVYSHFSFDDCMKSVEPTKWLIKGYIPEKSLGMMFGPSENGKSFVVIDMIASIACDDIHDWHGKFLKHGSVIYFAGEGAEGVRKRIKGFALKRGIHSANIEVFDEAFFLDDEKAEYDIENTIANIKAVSDDIKLVVFDTLNRFMSGDENKATDTGKMLRCFSRIIKECGCSVLILHHSGNSEDAKNRGRGSSAWRGAMDFEMKVTKSEKIITLEQTKSKDWQKQPNMTFKLEQIMLPECYDEEGEQESTCTIELYESQVTATTSEPAIKLSKNEQSAMKTFIEAIKRDGIRIKDEQTQHEFAAVELEHWRNVFYEFSTSDNRDSKKSEFSRVRNKLCKEKEILTKKEIKCIDFYCLDLNDDVHSDLTTRLFVNIALCEHEKAQAADADAQPKQNVPDAQLSLPIEPQPEPEQP